MRHPKPPHVIAYEEQKKAGPPKCCHTCDWYDANGMCLTYWMEPPEDFAATEGACPEWLDNIPF